MSLTLRGTLATLVLPLMLLAAGAQTAPPKPVTLSQEQKLQIENYAKDVKLAQQQIELLKVQMAGAMLSERNSAQALNSYLVKLRRELNAPADKWSFDGSTLSFVPKAAKTAAKPAAAKTGGGGNQLKN